MTAPVTYPIGTTQIAYTVLFDLDYSGEVKISIVPALDGGQQTRYAHCDRVALIDGQLRTYQLGDAITHVDGSPFQPGVYKLIVAAAGYPTVELPFEIRGVTHIFLPVIQNGGSKPVDQ